MRTRTKLCIIGLVAIALLGVWQVFTEDTYFYQKRNMEKARQHIPTVRSVLDAVPEFRHLDVGVYTGMGGSLAVTGQLPSESDVQRVRQIVDATAPTVRVAYRVYATNDLK